MKFDDYIKKYSYRVIWSEVDQVHIARCLELSGIAAHGTTAKDALVELEKVVYETLNWMHGEGEHLPEPLSTREFKGKISLRVPSDIHRRLAAESAEQGVSINQLILSKLVL